MRLVHCLYVALLVAIAGCAPATGRVAGTVTLDEKEVPYGTVSFIAAGKVVQGDIAAGNYDVDGVPVGVATVTVFRLDPSQPDPYDALNKARQQMLEKKAADPRIIDPKVVTDAAQLIALQKKRHLLPLSYAAPETSDLRCTVTAGLNRFDIPLKRKRP